MSKWSDIRVMNFLEIYEKHECLWNPRIESYKNKLARDAAFDAILEELNMPGLTANDVKLKIKSIRTTYKRELTSVLKSPKNENGSTYVPRLFWFQKANSFLREVSLARRSCTRMEYKPEEVKQQVALGTIMAPLTQSCKPESNEECQISASEQEEDDQQVILNGFNNGEMADETDPKTYKMDTCERTNLQCLNHQSSNCYRFSDEDEYVIFCRSVAAQLRAIPDGYSRSVAKFKIQQILFEAETGHYRKSAYITVPATQDISNL